MIKVGIKAYSAQLTELKLDSAGLTLAKVESQYFDEIIFQSNRNVNAPSLLLSNLIIYLDACLSTFSGQPAIPLIV